MRKILDALVFALLIWAGPSLLGDYDRRPVGRLRRAISRWALHVLFRMRDTLPLGRERYD